MTDVCEFIRQNPFASICFEPLENAGLLTKAEIPAVVISYNLLTYTRNMVKQLEAFTKDIIVIDNQSTYDRCWNTTKMSLNTRC